MPDPSMKKSPPTVAEYFYAIWESMVTVYQGLHITTRTWFVDPKQTLHYPDVDIRTGRLRGRAETLLGALRSKGRRLNALRVWFASYLQGNRTMGKHFNIGHKDYKGMLSSVIPNRFRGMLNVDIEICTACLACEKACPIDCIQILVEKDPENPKRRTFNRFDIDLAKCMYCGLCAEPCPTGSIYHTSEFESATPDFADFIVNYVPEDYQAIYKVKKVESTTIVLGDSE